MLQKTTVHGIRIFPFEEGMLVVSCAGIAHGANWAVDCTKRDWHTAIATYVREHHPRVRRLLMPLPGNMNGEIIANRCEFPRNHRTQTGITVHEGIAADGVVLGHGDAFAVTSADCPTFVLWADDRMVASHAGLRSMVQLNTTKEVPCWEQRHNVVENAFAALDRPPQAVRAFICCGIQTGYQFSSHHPAFGKQNASLHSWVRERHPACHHDVLDPEREAINMTALVRAELIKLGVPEEHIACDDIDTFADVSPTTDEHLWASNARSARQTPRDPKQRNLVVVART